MNIGLYIHIPFCKQKCLYCDFPSYAGLEQYYQDYIAALCQEITNKGQTFAAHEADTVFIGGGTPSLLPVTLLVQLLTTLKNCFGLARNVEFTMESNPGTVDMDKLQAVKEYGVNRLSFGVQSFNDALLTGIGRIHSAAEAVEAVNMARKAGFRNINLDLIYGLPKQSQEDVQDSLKQAVALGVEHISVYGLQVEAGTAFARQLAAGTLALPDEAAEEAMYDEINAFLPGKEFFRYEISNYAKNNYTCRHNIKYWRYQPYIGLGAAAYSFYAGKRFGNTVNVQKYMGCMQQEQSPVAYSETLETKTAMAEYVFLALRMTDGLHISDFNAYFNADFFAYYEKTVDDLVTRRLVAANTQTVRLTALGMKFGNVVFRAFLPDS